MHTQLQFILTPEQAENQELLLEKVASELKVTPNQITRLRILKKSIDARSFQVKINMTLEIYVDEIAPKDFYAPFEYQDVSESKPVLVIGGGPAGLFAALKLIENGLKPIVIERGKKAKERAHDIAKINTRKGFNTESNYCFGEGGAGTFSDGKLYSRSKKKGNLQRVYEIFHHHGAAEEILYEAHAHIGSDKLPSVVSNISKTIEKFGGEVHFGQKLVELITENNQVKGCKTESGDIFEGEAMILATGHSAHDIYEMLHNQNIALELKGFAMGVRIEHPQALIDSIQYHSKERNEYLPAASYSLVEQVNERGVY